MLSRPPPTRRGISVLEDEDDDAGVEGRAGRLPRSMGGRVVGWVVAVVMVAVVVGGIRGC